MVFSLFGPVFFYDVVRTARRGRYFVLRSGYLGVQAFILCWMYGLYAMQFPGRAIPPVALAEMAETFFYLYLAVQFLVVLLVTPAYTAGAIAEEKERRTMEFLLATDLRNREIVLGKFAARVGNLILLVLSALPILAFIQLIGGVDPDLLLGGYAATVLTLIELASLSILFSVYTRRARDAILLSYFAVLAYWAVSAGLLTLLQYPVVAEWIIFAGKPPYKGEELLWDFNIGNPFVMVYQLYHELSGGTPVSAALVKILRQYGSFCLGLSLVCCGWAVWRVRIVALRQAQGGRPRLLRRAPSWGRPRVGNDPMLWKEIFEPGLRFGWLGRSISLVVAILVLAPGTTILIDALEPHAHSFWGEELDTWIRVLVPVALTFMLVAVAVRAAASLSAERDLFTLDSLLVTPLSSNSILFAKWIGSIAGTRWAWFLLLAAWALGAYAANLEPLAFALLFLAWFVYAAFLAQLGLWFSLVSPTTLRATLRTLLVMLALGLGHWLLWLYYLPLFLHLDDQVFDPWLLKDLHLGLTPPAVLIEMAFVRKWSEAHFYARSFWQPAVFAALGLGLAALGTVVLFLVTRARFRVLCARTPLLVPERQSIPFLPEGEMEREGLVLAEASAPVGALPHQGNGR